MRTWRKALSRMMFLVMLLTLVPLPEARAADSAASAAGDGVRITQTAEWNREIPGGTAARVTINVSTDMDLQKPKDVVFVVDCSALQNLSAWKSCAKTLAGYLSAVPGMRYALVSYASAPEKKLDFTTDAEALKNQVDAITKGLNSDAYAALQMAESMINSRTDKGNPACIAYFGNGRFNMNYHKTLAYGKELQARIPVCCVLETSQGIFRSELSAISGGRILTAYDAAIEIGESKVCPVTVSGQLGEGFQLSSATVQVGAQNSMPVIPDREAGTASYTGNLTMGRGAELTIHANLKDPAQVGTLTVCDKAAVSMDGRTVETGPVTLSRSGYRVTYNPNGGEGKAPVDNTLYAGGTTVTLKPASLRRDGWNFSGWTHPTTGIRDGKFTITGDTTVNAAWGRAHVKLSSSTLTGLTGTDMLDRARIEALEGKAFYADTYWNNLESITIHNDVDIPTGAQSWDITDTSGQSKAGAVMAWVTPGDSTGKYHLHIGGKGGVIAPVSCFRLFQSSPIKSFHGLENLYTFKTTNMWAMFNDCEALTAPLNVGGWDVSKVTNMNALFSQCKSITELDVSQWNTENVENMSSVFSECENLRTVDISRWNTSKATTIASIFSHCPALSSVDVSRWKTGNVTNMNSTFSNCRGLSTLNVKDWDVSKVENMSNVFDGCSGLTNLDISRWNTSSVTDMRYMFNGCTKLTALNVSGWDVSKVRYMLNMFEGCKNLRELPVGNWYAPDLRWVSSMFKDCTSLISLDLSSLAPNSLVSDPYLIHFGSHEVFSGCTALTTLNVSGWNVSAVTKFNSMFSGCRSLTSLNLSGWNPSSATSMASMFSGCSSLPSSELEEVSGWDVSKVQNMQYMFYGCQALTTLDVSRWTPTSLTTINSIFYGCSNLTDIGVPDKDGVTKRWDLPAGCTYVSWRSGANAAMDEVHLYVGNEAATNDPTGKAANAALPAAVSEEVPNLTVMPEADPTLSAETTPAPEEIPAPTPEPEEKPSPAAGSEGNQESAPAENLEETLLFDDGAILLDSNGRPVYARDKIGVWDCGRVRPSQRIDYSLELQYLGEDVEDHGGVSGLLTVTNPIPAGLTFLPESLHISETAGWVDSVTPGSPVGTIVQQPEVDSNNVLTFSVTGLSMGAKFTVYYSCTAPAQAPASYIEFLNTASVDDNGLPDESDPVRHYMLAEGETDPPEKFAVSYAYDDTAPEGAPAYGTVTYAAGTRITLPQPVVPGWRFNGWKLDSAGDVVTAHTVTGPVHFVGSWTRTEIPKVKLAYSFTEPGPDSAAVIQPALLADAVTEAPENTVTSAPVLDAAPEGWTFAWEYPERLNVNPDGTFNVGHAADWPDGTIRVRGVWTRKSYDVTYVYSGAPSDAPALPSPNPQTHPWGAAVSLPPTPANTATHYFLGWTSPDITTDPDGTFPMPGKDITITGEWAAKPALAPDEHEVKVEPNGGTWRDSDLDTVLPRSEYDRMIAGQEFPDPVRNDGVEFLRWRTTSPDPDGLFDLVVTAQWREGITVAFDVQGHGTAPEAVTGLTSGDRVPKPSPDPAAPNYAFGGWFREPACTTAWRFDSDTVTNDITLYAKWLQVYQVSGTVTDPDGNPIANARVKIVHEGHETFWEDTTGTDGKYTITGVPSGIYNTVATYPLSGTEEVTTTILSVLTDHDLSNQVIRFAAGNTNSVLTVERMPETTPYVVVGGLEREAESVRTDSTGTGAAEVRVTMDVTPADQTQNQTEIQAIRTAAERAAAGLPAQGTLQTHVDLVLDIGLTREVTGTAPEKITSAANILELVIPYPMEGKANILVHRFHSAQDDREGAVTFTRLQDLPADTAGRADKTFYLDAEHGLIHVFAQKFSLYAVSYTTEAPVTPPVNPPANPSTSAGGGGRDDDDERGPAAGLLDTEDHRDYLHGFQDGLFRPNASMTRAQAAQMFYNLLQDRVIHGRSSFSDVPEGMWCYEAVSALKTLGVMQGVTEERFAPDRPITRAELVVTAVRFTEHRRGTASFTDVTETDWYYPEISAAASRGWIGGYPDGTFRPNVPITRAQAAAVINRLLGRRADEDFLESRPAGLQSFPDALPGYWAYEDIMEAANAHDYRRQGDGERWTALRRT